MDSGDVDWQVVFISLFITYFSKLSSHDASPGKLGTTYKQCERSKPPQNLASCCYKNLLLPDYINFQENISKPLFLKRDINKIVVFYF